MIERILRVIRLDFTVFREIAEDASAMTQAAIIVVVVSLMSAIGGFIGLLIGDQTFGRAFVGFIVQLLVNGILIGWIAWAIITYFVGTLLFKGRSDIPEMMRVLGFANAPNLLGLLSFIPCVGWIIALVGAILALIAGVLAIREAMEFDTGRAIVTVLVGWVISLILWAIIGGVFGLGFRAFGGIGA